MNSTSRILLDVKKAMLSEKIFLKKIGVTDWLTLEQRHTAACVFETTEDWRPIAIGDKWRCKDGVTRRFKARAKLPEDYTGTAVLDIDFGGEALVSINGEAVSALTSAADNSMESSSRRTRVYLAGRVLPGDEFDIEIEACLNFMEYRYRIRMGKDKEFTDYELRRADICVTDDILEGYLFDLDNAIEAMDTFASPLGTLSESNAQPNAAMGALIKAAGRAEFMEKKLHRAITKSLSALDFELGDAALRESIPMAREILKSALEEMNFPARATVHFLGHSHIDTAWLWPLKETVRKMGRTVANVLALLDAYPDFIFSVSQPQLLKYLEDYYPDMFAKFAAYVRDGRIELTGNAWVEMDTNVPSGESLVRQLLYGRKYYLEKFGRDSRVFWMPDVFGYTWALPQIMKRSGIDYFYTAKLNNNDTNRFPHSLFKWRGTDGSEVVAYLQRLGYNGELRAKTLSDIEMLNSQRDLTDDTLMTIGYGDGGGGPTYQMLENAKRLKNFPGLPKTDFDTAERFFEKTDAIAGELPVWDDEMYYEFHRGTYTSQANTKKFNRKGEQLLRKAEIACAAACLRAGKAFPSGAFEDIYRRFLTNQFHDILPGSSINEVYRDVEEIYRGVMRDAEALLDGALGALTNTGGVSVWNFHAFPAGGMVEIDAPEGVNAVRDGDLPVKSSLVNGKLRFIAENVPAMGAKEFTFAYTDEKFEGDGCVRVLENEFLRVTLDDNGNIESLYDKENAREALEKGAPGNLLRIFEDIPHRESGWNIDIEYQNKFWNLEHAESVTLIEDSGVRKAVRVVRKFNKSVITQDISLESGARRLDFITHVDWHEEEKLLKAEFTAAIRAQKATYEIQFGAIERPTHENTSYDRARFEVCAHRWADLSEGLYGISILNDCKYGYDIRENRMRITLMRSPNYPDPVADKGEHDFIYSVYPHAGDWRNGTVREAHLLNSPLMPRDGGAVCASLMEIDKPFAVVDAVKAAEDGRGFIVRVYESCGSRGDVRIALNFPVAKAIETNLMECDEKPAALENGALRFFIKPYEVKTFRLITGENA